ncbi:FecCD family ABC transporter permease [Nesterenkonia cremea]|uniref:Iron-enterobactin transporter permease n=1 Tax=Nesterenkonia cremea TaxID=1882340 RepID=A0A917ATM2_9MICC|nr:iron chelate uptake ABC transporter family permease subunit [Nesterenkonia cremea]GGE73610.1 iron-enterobactin transporter permease [Nesterenkonia cremea]
MLTTHHTPTPITSRPVVVGAALAAATAALVVLALGMGDYPLSPAEVLSALVGPLVSDSPDFSSTVVLEWRLPRITAAVVFGAALAVAGALFQTLTRNPLGSPDIIGFSTGAYTGVILATVVFGGAFVGTTGGAILGGLGTALLVYLLAYRKGVQGYRLIIVGIGVTAALHAVNSWILIRAETEVAMSAAIWGAGSLSLTSWSDVLPAVGVVLAALPLVLASVRPMRQLELGDDVASSHGVKVEPTRLMILGVGVLLTALVTATAGPIAFVALAAPQIARRLARSTGIPLTHSALTGAFLLLGADMVAQQALAQPIPVGMVTVILGGAYLCFLLVSDGRRER